MLYPPIFLILLQTCFDVFQVFDSSLCSCEQPHDIFVVLIPIEELFTFLEPARFNFLRYAESVLVDVLVSPILRVDLFKVVLEDLMLRCGSIQDALGDHTPAPFVFLTRGIIVDGVEF